MNSALAKLRYVDVFKFWQGVKLRNRIAILTSASLVGMFCFFSLFLYSFLSNDKRSYAHDSAFSESEVVASIAAREIVQFRLGYEKSGFLPVVGTNNAKRVNLVRWPTGGEVYFVREQQGFSLLLRSEDNVLVSGSATELIERISKKIPENLILLTSTGEIVRTGGRPVELISRYVVEFTSAGVRKGVHSFLLEGESKTFAFSEVMNTNLIAVSDVFVERAQEEVAKLSVLVFVSLIIFAVLAAILIAFLVRKSLAPLFQINEAASQIANGNFNYAINYQFKDEVSETFLRIDNMKTMLEIRDSKLKKTNDYLDKVLKIVRASVLASDKDTAIRRALSDLVTSDAFRSRVDAVYFQDGQDIRVESPENKFFLQQFDIGELASDTSLLSGDLIDVEDSLYIHEGKKVLLCDLRLSSVSQSHQGWIVIGPIELSNLDLATISFLSAFVGALQGMLENIELKNVAVDRGKMRLALEAASKIQNNVSLNVALPSGCEVAAKSQSAETVGGDWYGTFYHERSDTLYCYVTDVTGHGLNSTLVVSSVRGAVEAMHLVNDSKSSAEMADFLPDCAIALDELIAGISAGELTMTVCMMSLVVGTGEYEFLNFGHPAPWVISQDSSVHALLPRGTSTGPKSQRLLSNDALGSRQIGKKNRPVVTRGLLKQGETVCFYTDGLIECTNSKAEILGRRRARDFLALALMEQQRVADALANVFEKVQSYCSDEPIGDDISVLLLKRI